MEETSLEAWLGTQIMASHPITSWQTDVGTMETVTNFILLGSKITAKGDCRHEIKRHLLLERQTMTNISSVQSCMTLCKLMDCACQASLSFTISQSLLKLMSFELVMPSNHLILCRPLLLPSIFPSIMVFSIELTLWPNGGQNTGAYFQHQLFQWIYRVDFL